MFLSQIHAYAACSSDGFLGGTPTRRKEGEGGVQLDEMVVAGCAGPRRTLDALCLSRSTTKLSAWSLPRNPPASTVSAAEHLTSSWCPGVFTGEVSPDEDPVFTVNLLSARAAGLGRECCCDPECGCQGGRSEPRLRLALWGTLPLHKRSQLSSPAPSRVPQARWLRPPIRTLNNAAGFARECHLSR